MVSGNPRPYSIYIYIYIYIYLILSLKVTYKNVLGERSIFAWYFAVQIKYFDCRLSQPV